MKIAFIDLGNVGGGMTANLVKAGRWTEPRNTENLSVEYPSDVQLADFPILPIR